MHDLRGKYRQYSNDSLQMNGLCNVNTFCVAIVCFGTIHHYCPFALGLPFCNSGNVHHPYKKNLSNYKIVQRKRSQTIITMEVKRMDRDLVQLIYCKDDVAKIQGESQKQLLASLRIT